MVFWGFQCIFSCSFTPGQKLVDRFLTGMELAPGTGALLAWVLLSYDCWSWYSQKIIAKKIQQKINKVYVHINNPLIQHPSVLTNHHFEFSNLFSFLRWVIQALISVFEIINTYLIITQKILRLMPCAPCALWCTVTRNTPIECAERTSEVQYRGS